MFQLSKLYLTALLTIVTVTAINGNIAISRNFARSADLNLMQFMLRSSVLSQQNPSRSLGCFDYYVPLLNGITAKYEQNYAQCLSLAEEQRLLVDNSTQSERNAIELSANNACSVLSSCNKNSNSIPYFECYVNAGSENSKVMYSISANASVILAEVREKIRLIDNEQNRCTNASERAYVEDTASTYAQLQSCLQGISPVPTTLPPTTTSEITTVTSSPVPTTTSEEPTSPEAPEEPEATTEN